MWKEMLTKKFIIFFVSIIVIINIIIEYDKRSEEYDFALDYINNNIIIKNNIGEEFSVKLYESGSSKKFGNVEYSKSFTFYISGTKNKGRIEITVKNIHYRPIAL